MSIANTRNCGFIDADRADLGAEPVCAVAREADVQVASSTYAARNRVLSARRAGHDVGRDQVARLMKTAGITGGTGASRFAPPTPVQELAGTPDQVGR